MRTIRANCSREQFARTRIHTDANDQLARQNTLTSLLTLIVTHSVYRFRFYWVLRMFFRRKSRLLLCMRMLKSRRRPSLLMTLLWRRFGSRKRKWVHNINSQTRRQKQGDFLNLFQELLDDEDRFVRVCIAKLRNSENPGKYIAQ